MATANMKDVKRRIKSVESTMQITKAMQLVASSKLRKAKKRAEDAQPYFDALYETMCDISRDSIFKSMYTKNRDEKSTLLVVIAGDRGLAGGFNSNVLKSAFLRWQELKEKNREVHFMPIGKKSVEFFEKRGANILEKYQQIAEPLTVYDAMDISNVIINAFKSGVIDRVELYFTTFVSSLVQEPEAVKVLPVDMPENKPSDRSQTVYDPSPVEVFDGLMPRYIAGILYGAIVESFASEQASRRTAMENASDNAEEMINSLSLLYNRARQATITQEITEIVSGSQ